MCVRVGVCVRSRCSHLVAVHFALLLLLRLDQLVPGVRRPLLLRGVFSVSPLGGAVAFVPGAVPLRAVAPVRGVRVGGRVGRPPQTPGAGVGRVVSVSVVSVRSLRVSVAAGAPVRRLREFPAARGVPLRRVRQVDRAGRVRVGGRVPGVAPAGGGGGGVERGVRRRLAGRLRGAEADGGRLLVEGQRAVAVLAGEDRRGAAVARLVGRLALDGHVRLAPARVVGLQEGAVHEALGHCKRRET